MHISIRRSYQPNTNKEQQTIKIYNLHDAFTEIPTNRTTWVLSHFEAFSSLL